ncbi:lysozyme family protein [Shouchella clausii]|uniref:lysozyme family protein n=1 Tax=Shouchella clausii TaxID=79880 RepID=UPI00289D1F76|nr:lysozyme family protein [Shouchella clausii]
MKKTIGFVLFLPILFVLALSIVIVAAVSGGDNITTELEDTGENLFSGEYRFNAINKEVERYRPYFERYAKENGIEDYVEILMGMTMQESGGRLADVMQSSESLGLPVNTLGPEASIKQGVKYFSQVLDAADGDVELALQAYNMGNGFIDYAKKHNNGKYSKELAQQFSTHMKNRLGWRVYGDPNYVDNVMRYLEPVGGTDFAGGSGKWALPLKNIRVTSGFGPRTHPITGQKGKFHGGLDFACTPADDILSVADGKVVEAIHSNVGYGNYVTVQHGSNEFSRYAHLSRIGVTKGDNVSQGDSLGKCGTTGSSTGNHLHLEHLTKLGQRHQDKIDPKKTLGL